MTLAPKLPPGRANRKALQFAIDIHRLRDAGYTFSAIRMALLDAGISVSLSTIEREAARREICPKRAQLMDDTQHPPSRTVLLAAHADATTPLQPMSARATGREIAEAFFSAHLSNPLFASKEVS